MAGSSGGLIAGGVAVGAAIIGLVWAASSKSSSSTPAAPTQPSGGSAWLRTTTIHPGDHVRIAVSEPVVATLASAAGFTNDLSGFEKLLASVPVQNFLAFTNALAWAPGDPKLPSDWPSDDPVVGSEYHAQFVYTGSAILDTSTSPIPLYAWVQKGLGVGGVQQGGGVGGVKQPVASWLALSPSSSLNVGDHVRLALTPGSVNGLTTANGYAFTPAGLQAALAGTGIAAITADATKPIGVWAPGDASLPADWPTSDPNVSKLWHADFVVATLPKANPAIKVNIVGMLLNTADAAWVARMITLVPVIAGTTGELPGSFWDKYFPSASKTIGGLLFLYAWDPTGNAWLHVGPAWPQAPPGGFDTGTCDALALAAGSQNYFGSPTVATYVLAFYLAPSAVNWSWVMFAPYSAAQIAAITYDAEGCPSNAPTPTLYAAGHEPV